VRLRIFAVLIGFSSYFLRGAKYVTAIFFYFTPASENLRQVEFTKVGELLWSFRTCIQYTKGIRVCYYTDKRFDALKLLEDTEIHLLWVATWCMIEIALLRTCQLNVVHVVVKERVLWHLLQR
jgi:hypothetical protein